MIRYRILALLCLVAVIANVQRSAISVPSKRIQTELGMDDAGMGLVMAIWYWGYGALQVPSGWLADRWGSRRSLTAFALTWSLLTGLVAFAANGSWMLVLWCAMGAAQAGVFPCAAKMIGVWFRDTEHARASGILGSSMALGIALAPLLTAALLRVLPWQQIFLLYALPGLAWAIAFYVLVPERPMSGQSPNLSETPSGPALRTLLSSVFVWLLCAQQFLRAAAMVFFTTWFPRFLQETRNLSDEQAE